MTTPVKHPPTILITGPSKSGRTTLAVLIGAQFHRNDYDFLHNGTALFGTQYDGSYLGDPDGLLRLANDIPANTPALIEEADLHEATRQTDDPSHEATIMTALAKMAEKQCLLLLTTVQGKERDICRILVDNASSHVTPLMDADKRSLATIKRRGKYLIPDPEMTRYDSEEVLNAMLLADTFKAIRHEHIEDDDERHVETQIFSVKQRSIDEMKKPEHPAYPVYYRYRIVHKVHDHTVHWLTKEQILNFQWLESINEHPHETIVLETIKVAATQWGFQYEPVETPQDDKFPDGKAIIDGQATNLEVVSTQPIYPSGANLHRLVAMTQPSRMARIANPPAAPILVCSTCKRDKLLPQATFENLPEHDDDHIWVVLMPGTQFDSDFPDIITVTPRLNITQEDFTKALQEAVQAKSKIIAEQGGGTKNWVIVLSQGFPVIPQWYDDLPQEWPTNVDGIVAIATEEYMGAFHNWEAQHNLTVILLKCPATHSAAKCYHPSYIRHLENINPELLPLLEEGYTPEQLAQMTMPWTPTPIKSTLTVRDENGNVIDKFLMAKLAPNHISEILQQKKFAWSGENQDRMALACQEPAKDYSIKSQVEVQHDDEGGEYWTATVQDQSDKVHGDFQSREEAMHWCEAMTAVTLLHRETR